MRSAPFDLFHRIVTVELGAAVATASSSLSMHRRVRAALVPSGDFSATSFGDFSDHRCQI